jgi:hypothetical protein
LRASFSSDNIDGRCDLFDLRSPSLMTTASPHAVSHTGRLLLHTIVATLLVACVGVVPAARHSRVVSARQHAAAVIGDESGVNMEPALRLGNAAGAYGWSTALGDFNADGRIDAIVADRVAPDAAGYSYRIDFQMSGQAPEHVTFDSIRDAVAITVSDVDRDNDLDVVARAVFSGETVGLWLNDGHGHFTSAGSDTHPLPATVYATQIIGVSDMPFAALIAGVPPRRADEALPSALRAPPADASRRALLARSASSLPTRLDSSDSQPRAPPTSTL